MKKKTTAFVICIFLLVALFIIYIFSELYTESDMTSNTEKTITDSVKFENEYEDIEPEIASNYLEEYILNLSATIPEDIDFVTNE